MLRTFTVTGPHAVFGTKPGETLEIDIPEAQADRLIMGGHLREKIVLTPSPEPAHEPEPEPVLINAQDSGTGQ